jgi:glycosyltransferase involved in cell wall biosynthesis
VVAGSGLLVDPRNVAELRDALCRLLTSPSLREEMARRGTARAEVYRWEAAARESWQFFEEMV